MINTENIIAIILTIAFFVYLASKDGENSSHKRRKRNIGT